MGDCENRPTESLVHLVPVLKSLAGGGITRYSGRIRSSLNVDVSESNNQFHLVVLFLSFSNLIVNVVNILKKSKDTASTNIDRSMTNMKDPTVLSEISSKFSKHLIRSSEVNNRSENMCNVSCLLDSPSQQAQSENKKSIKIGMKHAKTSGTEQFLSALGRG